jgi:carboxyl-terminal processing protease
MLGTLDPHSSFFDPREYAQMRERQGPLRPRHLSPDRWRHRRQERVRVTGYKVGIRRGDVISRISGEDTKNWQVSQAQSKLRGGRGTPVQIEIRRKGYAQAIPLQVVRDEVYIPTVPAYFMIDATTGYIRMQDFGENTDRDIRRALSDLARRG